MRFQRQKQVIERIENVNVAVLKKQRQYGRDQIQTLWGSAKDVLRVKIRGQYKRDFPSGNWTQPLASRRHTIDRMMVEAGNTLLEFQSVSVNLANRHFKKIYRTAVLRNAYLLDMVTPRSYRVELPKNRMFTEADAIKTYMGPDADTAWKVRWSAWMDAYRSALESNLRLGALNDSTIEDVQDEVDKTRAGTPAYETGSALDRIFTSQAVALQAQAQMELSSLNDDMGLEEIWQTSFSARVCDICDEQKGLTSEEAEADIPAHPNCECYWRLVPSSWAELLKSGSAEEVDLAKWMDANGVVPGAMVIRNDAGDEVGAAIVSFENWVKGQPTVVTAR